MSQYYDLGLLSTAGTTRVAKVQLVGICGPLLSPLNLHLLSCRALPKVVFAGRPRVMTFQRLSPFPSCPVLIFAIR